MKAVVQALAVVVLAIVSGVADCQESARSLRLHVDGAADASVVQVQYMLAGPFGGYRTEVRGSANQIYIPLAVRGQPAQSLKAIVFSPGYHTARVEIEDVAAQTDLHVALDPLPVRRLSGTVEFVGGAKPRSFILDIDVHVGSSHEFFGIVDGPLTKFDVAEAVVSAQGKFSVDVSDLAEDGTLESPVLPTELSFHARDAATGNFVFELKPGAVAIRDLPQALMLKASPAIGIVGLPVPASAAATQPGPPALQTASDVRLPVDAETLERQYRVLSSMPSVEVAYSALGPVRSIQGATGIVLSRATRDLEDGQEAREILQKFKDVLLATGSETLKVRRNDDSVVGRIIMVDQFIGGIPVLYGSVGVTLDDATGLVTSLNASFLPDRGLPRQPQIAEKDVAALAQQQLAQYGIAKPGSIKTTDTPTLTYVGTHPDSTRGHLAWVVHATYTSPNGDPGNRIYWLDAIDGAIVGSDVLNKNATVKAFTGN